MITRELKPEEWTAFFNAFSRRYQGELVTVELVGPPDPTHTAAQVIARRMTLVGITAERPAGLVFDVEIMLGDGDNEHLVHIIHNPTNVRVAQVTNGADEVFFIDAAGQTTRVDFSPAGLPAGAFVDAPGVTEVL